LGFVWQEVEIISKRKTYVRSRKSSEKIKYHETSPSSTQQQMEKYSQRMLSKQETRVLFRGNFSNIIMENKNT
jgi:hypothetical protein